MRRARLMRAALLPALLAIGPVVHEADAAPPRPDCGALQKDLIKPFLTPQSRTRVEGDACVFENLRVKAGTMQAWSVRRLTVQGLAGWNAKTTPIPPHIRVEAKDILFSPDIESPHARYQIALNQKPFDARLEFDTDFTTMQLALREATIESPWMGRLSFGFEARMGDGQMRSPEGMFGLKLSRIHLALDNRYVFESMVMPMFMGMVPDDKDPAVEFPRMQKDMERKIGKLPEGVADASSRDAMIRFTRDFPHPTGHFETNLTLRQPLPLEDIMKRRANNMDWANMATLSARYEPLTR